MRCAHHDVGSRVGVRCLDEDTGKRSILYCVSYESRLRCYGMASPTADNPSVEELLNGVPCSQLWSQWAQPNRQPRFEYLCCS